ncbi:MAG TPA: sulfotransferase [Glycomyces sp.]
MTSPDTSAVWSERAVSRAKAEAEAVIGVPFDGLDGYLEDWKVLLDCYAASPAVSLLGRRGMLMELRRRLTNRLRVARALATHPEIAAEPIEAPIIVTGLPRTGTTFTHNLLASPRSVRAPRLWEMFHTVPGDLPEDERAAAVQAAQAVIDGVAARVPNLLDIHEIAAEAPEECIALLSFHSLQWIMAGPVEPMHQWFARRDPRDDYRYLRQALQVLQHGRPRRRWVLKSPCHLWTLKALTDVFPDATIVWTHRDPVAVVGSYSSLTQVGWEIFQRRFDPADLGRFVLRRMVEAVEFGHRDRAGLTEAQIIDVDYHSLTAPASDRARTLFDQLGLPWDEAAARHRADLDGRHGARRPHDYGLDRYGLTASQVATGFGAYAEAFAAIDPYREPTKETRT